MGRLLDFFSTLDVTSDVEKSTCPKLPQSWKQPEELHLESLESTTNTEAQIAEVRSASLQNPEARSTAFHSIFMDTCTLCGQPISGTKGVMQKLLDTVNPRLQQICCLTRTGETGRFCAVKVDAPGPHALQCVPLLQARACT